MTPDFEVGKDNKWFRQYVGIDIAKEKFNACLFMYDIASDMGCGTKSIEFSNTKTGFNQLVRWVRKEAIKDYPISFVMEPTGVYYESLAYHLCNLKQTVHVVLPNKARDFCKYEGVRTKTDAIDSKCLAMLGCKDRQLKPWTPPKQIYKELRQMTRFVGEIGKVRTILVNHLEALSHSVGAEKTIIRDYEKLIANIDKQLEDNEKNIKAKIAQDEELNAKIDRICTIKGIGFITVVTIVAETDGFNMITNRKQLASFAGLDVCAKQSGPEDPRHHITKKGNVHIRRALYFPAVVSTRFNPQSKDLYGRICKRNPTVKMIGVTAAMRKLLLLVFTLWKNGEVYDATRSTTSTSQTKTDNRIMDKDGRPLIQEDTIQYNPSDDEEVIGINCDTPPF